MGSWNWDRLAAGSALPAIVLFVIGSFLPGSPPALDDSRAKIVHFFASNHRSGLVGSILGGIAFIFFLWFASHLAATLRRGGEDRLAGVSFGGAIVALGLAGLSGTLNTALFWGAARHAPLTAKPLYTTAVIATTIIGFPVAAWIWGTAIACWRSKILPVWYAQASALAGLVVLFSGGALAHSGFYSPTGAYAYIGFVVFLAWLLVTSWLLIVRAEQAPRAAPTPAG
jgi:hypothetical protein